MKLKKKYLLKIFISIFTFCIFTQSAGFCDESDGDISLNEKIASVGFGKMFVSDSKKDITNVFKKLDSYTEKKDAKKIRKLFSDNFVNNDGFDIDTYMKSIKYGFSSYDNRNVVTKINSIVVFDDYAIAHVSENAEAETQKPSPQLEGKGLVLASADVYYYLTKDGRNWKITSANVIDENCTVLYGAAKSIYFSLNVPNQIKSGTEYTTTLSFTPMKDTIVMASLSTEPIIYPLPLSKEVFKTVKGDGILERIFVSNDDNYNEYVIASIGMSKAKIINNSEFNLKLVGTAYVIRRVNVFKPMTQKPIQHKKPIFKKTESTGVIEK